MSERLIKVKVITKAKTEKVEKIEPGTFRVRTTEVPEKGKANARVTELLAEYLGIPRYQIFIKSGHTSREKIFIIEE